MRFRYYHLTFDSRNWCSFSVQIFCPLMSLQKSTMTKWRQLQSFSSYSNVLFRLRIIKWAACLCLLVTSLIVVICNATVQESYAAVAATKEEGQEIVLTTEERAWLESNPEITLGYADSQEPQLIVKSDGSYSGIVVDLLDELNRRLGTSIKLAAFPIKELIANARAQKIDGILNLHPGYADRLEMLMTNGYFQNFPAVFARRDLAFSGPEDISGKTVAIIDKAFFSEELIREYEEQATIIRVKSALEGLQSLQKGEADIFIGVSHNSYFISKYQLYDVEVRYIYTDYKDRTVIAVRPDWPKLVGILNKGLSSFSDAELKQIVGRWVRLPEQERIDLLTAEDRDWLAAHPDIELGYTDAFEPEVIVNDDGSYRGTMVDVLALLNQRLGTDIKLTVKPIPDIIKQISNKELPGVMAIHPDYADKLGWLKTRSFATSFPAVFARQGFMFNAPSDLAGKKIALIDKIFFSQNLVDIYGDGSTLVKVADALEGIERVRDGTADLFIGSSTNSYLLGKYQLFDITVPFQFYEYPIVNSMAVRSDWPQLASILNKGLASISTEEVASIYRKWVNVTEQEDTIELTQDERRWLAAHPDIELGYTDASEPEIIVNPDGSYSGMLIDFLAELNQRLGTQIGLEIDTVPGILEQAKTKKVDGILEMLPEYADKLGLLKTATYLPAYPAIFGRHDVSYKGPSDCSGKKVAINDKILFSEKIAQEYCEQATIVKVSNSLEGLRLVSQGDVSFFIGAGFNSYHISKYQLFDIVVKQTFFDLPSRFGMAIRPDWPEFVSILNKGITSFTKNEIDAIVAKWVHSPPPKEFIVPTPEERAWLSENHTVRVRATDWPPYLVIKENAPPQGIAVEYLKLIEERTGINFEYDVTDQPFGDFLENMQQNQGPDMTTLIVKSPEREQYLAFTTPYISSPYVIFARENDNIILKINDLEGKTVAVPEGFVMQQQLERDFPEIRLIMFENDENAIHAVSTGEVDAYIGNLTVSSHLIQKQGLTNLRVVAATPYGDQALSMGNRKDWPELTQIVDKALASITEEEKAAIRNKFTALRYEQGINRAEAIKWALIVVVTSTGILCLFLFWNRQLSRKVQQRTNELQETVQTLTVEVKEREAAEKALAAKEAEELALINAVNNSFFLMETNGTIVIANESLADMYDKTASELVGTNTFDYLPEDIAERRREHVTRAVSSGEVYVFEDERSGRIAEHRLYPIRDDSGVVEKLAVFATDITEAVATQRLLKTSEEEFRSLVEQSPLSIQIFSPDGTLSTINQAWTDLWGIYEDPLQDVIDKYNILEDEEARERGLMALIEQAFGGESVVMPVVEYDASITLEKLDVAEGIGHSRYVQLRMYPVKNSKGEVLRVVGIEEDLTEKIQAEEALRQSHDYLEHVTSTMVDAIFSVKMPERIIEWANDSYQVLGYTPEEYFGKSGGEFYSDPESFREVDLLLESAIAAGDEIVNIEIDLRRKNGEIFPAELSATLLRENGEVTSLTVLVRDITDRKKTEEDIKQYQNRLKALASQLTIFEEAERRRIAAGLHDHIGQILAFSRIQLAKAKKQASDDSQVALLDEISQSLLQVIEDTKELIFDLSSPLLNEIGLDAAIADWLEHQIRNRHGLEYTYRQEELIVELNEIERSIIFRNFKELVTNIVKHAKASRIDVQLSCNDEQLVLSVADDGLGFNAELADNKSSANGGFGLFSIQERMADIGGTTRILSEPGRGCAVTLTLPVQAELI